VRDADRFKLLGTYKTPRVRAGAVLACEARDCDVIVVGYSGGRIPWPVGRRRGSSARALVVYAGLADAVRRESNLAVAHWFGVTPKIVSKWRKALGVGPATAGTARLKTEYAKEPWFAAARAKAAAPWTEERRARQAERCRGKPRPRHVIEAMRKGRLGRPHTLEARAKMSAAHRTRGTRPPAAGEPWAERENELVRTRPAPEAARRTGRTLSAVYNQRVRLGVPDGRRR
jgi:hypothetical protein